MRFLSRLIPRSTGGRWALGTGLAAVVGVGIYLVFFVFAFHLIFVDEVVDEEGPEFAVEADIDALISEALDTAGTETASEESSSAAAASDGTESDDAGSTPVADESMSVAEHPDDDESTADAPAEDAPAATAAAPPPTTEAEQGVRVAYVGSFGPRSHPAVGTAAVLTDGTQTFLRFDDDFATDNGPDLNVYLHTAGSRCIGR